MLYDRYQARVGRVQSANTMFVADGGFFNVGDVAGGANGVSIPGLALMRMLLSPVTRTSYTLASAIQTVSVIPNSLGLITMNYPSATTSCKLPVANYGAVLILNFANVVSGTMSILPGSNPAGSAQSIAYNNSGVSVIAYSGIAISTAWLQLACNTANEWAVVSFSSATNINMQRDS
jgi:hypothetical protein